MFGKILFILACTFLSVSCASKKKIESNAAANPAPPANATPATAAPAAKPETASVAQPPQIESLICKRAEENRSIEIEPSQPQGCRLWYTRNGTRSAVASSVKSAVHCNQVRDRIRSNLENADFKCTAGAVSQNVAPTTASTTTPKPTEPKK